MIEPAWRTQAQELERQDRLAEAERVITDALRPNFPFAAAIADLYRERLDRLRGQGRTEDAARAHERAVFWIDLHASFATSGGEGAALSREADTFKRGLGPVPRPQPPGVGHG